jgi:hypothetical protein
MLLLVSMSPAWLLWLYPTSHPKKPRVVEAVVKSPRNLADDPLHNLLVLRRWSLHESTNVADGECQV